MHVCGPMHAGIKVVIVFDAITSQHKEAQRDKLSEQLEVVFSAGGARFTCADIDSTVECSVRSSLDWMHTDAAHSHLCPGAGSGTADEFIEAEVQLLRAVQEPPLVYVATSDRVSGDVSAGGGAVMISSEQLIRNIMKTDEEARCVVVYACGCAA